jgi:predicted nuclease of predicted toxin-antitoxin system
LKILLDENIPHDLRPFLRHHETFTASYMGYAGLKNGKLLDAAEADDFDVLITGDKTLHYEQNMQGRDIALISLSAVGWSVIEPHVSKIVAAVDRAMPGSFTRVECGKFSRGGQRPVGPSLG